MNKGRLIGLESSDWIDALNDVPHDIYHLPEYVGLSAKVENAIPHLFLYQSSGGTFCLPLLLRRVPDCLSPAADGLWDASSPYGYPGPVLSVTPGHDPDAFLEMAMDEMRVVLRAHSVVSCFIRSHPLLTPSDLRIGSSTHVVTHGRTVSIDLTQTQADIWKDVRHNHRRDINKANRQGITVSIDTEWAELSNFLDVYHQTMRRLEATEEYFFTRQYFDHLRSILDESLVLCVVKDGNSLLTAGLFSEYRGIVQYMLSGTTDEGLAMRSPKSMIYFMQQWAQTRGNQYLHLGGGLGGSEDALFSFKAGFSKHFSTFATWRMVVNPEAYARLARSWEWASERAAEPLTGYFPSYRKGFTSPALTKVALMHRVGTGSHNADTMRSRRSH